ncbi:TetR/AcrR family transcriptional regulator [Vibrio vulnificus]|uniref:TetR/AcrR family transcriptional regulator n=1 Tax=Vibrio vulnificus TaxID=672 RepID=UPI000CD2A20E|nr:TetR/AcrR family transcriptional regulator [Vibrio vulnificus]EIV1851701.1 TetR/AcrR family transcriptional regulator [Vibrio vulnificus]ELU4007393.1 TetR/AcrR family transcriptional regulator [Vibrio vulnificus]POB92632.1 TetR family transcriptional regulator [Vibrio vulnificus]RZP56955.1 TetR/AcrR family transcriptional regulator [Vibrio vulnificus]HDY8036326.1 TetR/AcrR family transcriptional regulator [Vibrio vulnificus]
MSKGRITKEHILQHAFQLASENGLESLTIGELAKQCGMSKSGLFAHFNAKLNLQLSVLEYANLIFAERVIAPARLSGDADMEKKIRGLLDNWMTWNHSFQGSCMFLDAWNDAAPKECELQKALQGSIAKWLDYLQIQVEKGMEHGAFSADLNAQQAVFELYGLYLSAHVFYAIRGEEVSLQHFWQGVDRLLAGWKNG